ncbi:MAG TPA: hypothetical protein VNV88_13420, partial [Candidatus Solibacter sp.]|nr:hypothetical protein [Candidatus Solibacter sp.]
MTNKTKILMPRYMLPNHKRLGAICIVLSLFAGLESYAQSGPPACPAPPAAGKDALGKMCVRLQVQNGRIIATSSNTAFWIPPAFTSALSPKVTLGGVEVALENQLGQILGGLPMPYQAALAPGEIDSSLSDPATNALRTFNGSLANYAQIMQPWSDSNPARGQPADVLVDSSSFFAPMIGAAASSSLSYADQLSSLDQSLAVFRFPAPFQSQTVMLQLPNSASPRQQARIRELRKTLAPLDGTLWDKNAIERRLNGYYARLGLAAQAVALNAGVNTVVINEGPRVARILLPDPDVTDHDV